MNAERANNFVSKASSYLLVAALSALATSGVLHTPQMAKKAEEADVLKPIVAKDQVAIKQLKCDKAIAVKVAVDAITANQYVDAASPDYAAIHPCPKVKK